MRKMRPHKGPGDSGVSVDERSCPLQACVRGLGWDIIIESLKADFVQYGDIEECSVIKDKQTGVPHDLSTEKLMSVFAQYGDIDQEGPLGFNKLSSTQVQVHGYIDSDWAGSSSNRRSTIGYMFSFGSATITWSSKKQPTLALSSIEAEYRGAKIVACEVAWLEMLLQDLEIQVQDLAVIYYDNPNNIQLAQNSVFHARTKHIEVHYHFIRERVLDDDIELAYVGTEDQAADLFTKALGAEKLQRFRGMLGLWDMALSLRGSVEISRSMPT
ncbi:hypothetical protein L7F22_043354 [Adiantum nelumboides]|nr:hypothetical protein [Adiantum nelumboides]